MEYRKLGTLHPFPAAVARETAAYRADEDPLGDFLETWLSSSEDPSAVLTTTLFLAYTGWADGAGVPKSDRLSSRSFGRMFAERHRSLPYPVTQCVSHGKTGYRGLKVGLRKEPPESETDDAGGKQDPENETDDPGGLGGSSDPSSSSSHAYRDREKPETASDFPPDPPSGPDGACQGCGGERHPGLNCDQARASWQGRAA